MGGPSLHYAGRCTPCCVRCLQLTRTMYAVKGRSRSLSQPKEPPSMATDAGGRPEPRSRLTRDQVLRAAIASADAGGLEALTMRTLAEMLGVAPMALYRHVANKDDLIDGMVDVVFSEIGVPSRLRRLEDVHAAEGDRDPRRAVAPPVGRRFDGVTATSGPGEPAPPRCGDRQAPGGGVRRRDGRPRVLGPGQLHLRVRADEDEPAVRDRGRGRRGVRDHARSRSRSTSTPTSSSSSTST